jgi:hypothetical protein
MPQRLETGLVRALVPHRQYVFTAPRRLRLVFACRRAWLGEWCRIAARLLADAYVVMLPGAKPGLIRFVQTFGDLVNFNPHVPVLAADGAFLPDGCMDILQAMRITKPLCAFLPYLPREKSGDEGKRHATA